MNKNSHPVCPEDQEELLNLGCTPLELWALGEFARPFSATARLYLGRLFVRGVLHKKRFAEILTVCHTVFDDTWQYGTPHRIGDPDDITPPGWGMRNAKAFMRAYRDLALPAPKFLF